MDFMQRFQLVIQTLAAAVHQVEAALVDLELTALAAAVVLVVVLLQVKVEMLGMAYFAAVVLAAMEMEQLLPRLLREIQQFRDLLAEQAEQLYKLAAAVVLVHRRTVVIHQD